MTEYLFENLRRYALSLFRCEPHSIHGMAHWRNVDDSARLICKEFSADLIVVRFFAFLHDACRFDDGTDLDHGLRAADNLNHLPQELAHLNSEQMTLLRYAIRHHTDGCTSADPTVGACWDADRLDLGRVGIIPAENLMSTQPGNAIARLGSKRLYMEKKNSNITLNGTRGATRP